jgi:natural product biosynthesis luciferase-like monooxygenase protein
MELSLFFFAADARPESLGGRYDLLLDAARFADDNGFAAVWTPERHFHPFGGLYPNPSVTGAAAAAVTRRVGIRGGSVVLPLHDPLRVAEEWSVVDNLSGGRVGLAFAPGWHAHDFALRPEAYASRKARTYDGIEVVRSLWRGEPVTRRSGTGEELHVRTLPPPVQRELPVWIASGGDPGSFRKAGELRANLLTHLLSQSVPQLAGKISVYRQARAQADGGAGHVTLMLHTHLGADTESVREAVREPFSSYLRTSADLMTGPPAGGRALTERELDFLVRQSFDRYFGGAALFGTAETAARMLDRLRGAGVDEVACLIDFGMAPDATWDSLALLARLCAAAPATPPHCSGGGRR